jgi:hypothetical protein
MKRSAKLFLLAAAFLTVPVTLRALNDTSVQVTNYVAVGNHVVSGAWQCLAVGYNNAFAFSGGSSACYGSAAVGYGLQISASYSLVAGMYNTPVSNAYLIVGNGTSTTRSNALEVLSTGAVNIPGTANIGKLPDRGGISMGPYTLP